VIDEVGKTRPERPLFSGCAGRGQMNIINL